MMDEGYYGEAYLFNGGGGGGNGDYGYGGGFWSGEVGGGYEPIDYAPGFELLPQQEPQFFELELSPELGPIFFGLPYVEEPLPFEPLPGEFGTGLWLMPGQEYQTVDVPLEPQGPLTFEDAYFDWLAMGLNPDDAAYFATLDLEAAGAGEGTIRISGAEQEIRPEPPMLPDLPPMSLPYIPSPWDVWQTPPIIPPFEFEEPIPPAPPIQKLGPCNTPTGLPGPCAGGFYHPMDNPCACVPFPPAPPATQTPRPPTQQPSQAPRPPAQQQPRPPQTQQQPCPTGYCKHPTTGQCMPIPQGYVRHPQTQVCTAQAPQVSPLPIPSEAEDMFADLKKLPWWVWAAGAGLLFLGMGGEERRTTTVRYRRGD